MALRPKAALVLGATFALAAAVPRLSAAQHITIDGRFSPAQTLVGPNYSITAGLGKQVGSNLFHSFGQLGLTTGESATFSGPATISNVIGRVTGGNASSIDGKIQSNIAGANLYLINPSGVVFGPNATVNVSGSFHASTADYLKMSDGAKFQATNPDASTLSAAPPAAFGFLTARPAALTVDGSNLGPVQGTLGLVGGPVSITGATLSAPAGTIHVTSAVGIGEVAVDPRNTVASTVSSFGPVAITGGSTLDVSNPSGLGAGGSVFIRSGALTIDASEINADNYGSGAGGQLVLRGDSQVALSNRANAHAVAYGTGSGAGVTISTAPSGVISADASTVLTDTSGSGAGGALSLEAGRLTVTNGANVLAQSSGAGTGGAVDVKIGGPLTVDSGASLGTVAYAAGNAGNVSASTAGPITIDMSVGALPSILQGIGSLTYGIGNAGNVTIAGGALSLVNNGEIASNTFGPGNAGKVTVTASGQLIIDGLRASSAALPTGIFSEALQGSGGSAGNLSVAAGTLTLRNSGEIASNTSGLGKAGDVSVTVDGQLTIDGTAAKDPSKVTGISSDAEPGSSGGAGKVTVNAGTLSIANNGEISSSTFASGNAGQVSADIGGQLWLDGGGTGIAAIAADSVKATGAAGSVSVKAGSLSIVSGGEISSNAGLGNANAGTVEVHVDGPLSINGGMKGIAIITADSLAGTGNAGDVTVTAGALSIGNGGEIGSDAGFGIGRAGKISVNISGQLTVDGGAKGISLISASSVLNSGNSGDVTVKAAEADIRSGGLISTVSLGAMGSAGNVSVDVTGRLTIDRGFILSSSNPLPGITSTGNAGNVAVSAARLEIINGGVISTNTSTSGNGGTVSVTTGTLSIARNGAIVSNTFGAGKAGSVSVTVTGQTTIDATSANTDFLTGIAAQADPSSTGDAGNVQVSAGSLIIHNGAKISSRSLQAANGGQASTGNAGTVAVDIAGLLSIDGSGSTIATSTGEGTRGNAGSVMVTAGQITLISGGEIASTTAGMGVGGSVFVTTPGALLLDDAGVANTQIAASATGLESGPGGSVSVTAGSLTVKGGAQIASTTSGPGKGGTVQVIAQGPLSLSDPGSGIIALANSSASGDAGSVKVGAPQIAVSTGAEIASTTAGTGAGGSVDVTTPGALVLNGAGIANTQIAASATGLQSGPGGSVSVTAGSLTVEGGAQIASSTAGRGKGGDVNITVASDIVLPDPGPQITAQSTGSGDAGSITVSAVRVLMNNGAAISTEAATSTANGGNITLHLRDFLYLVSSEISTSVKGETGNGGNIAIDPHLVILDRSSIIAQAVEGHGGNITITADQFIPSSDSLVSASSQLGISGTVVINGPRVDVNGALVVLSTQLRGRTEVLREACESRAGRPLSSFVEAGRGGLPQDPEATLPALYIAGRDLDLNPETPAGTAELSGAPLHTIAHLTMRCS